MLLRHGKSDWHAGAADDFSRPLNRRGEKAGRRIARWLQDNRQVPEYIISSPATRACRTAELVCDATGMAQDRMVTDRRLYHAGVGELLAVIRQAPPELRSLMVVGHNPGLEELLEYLCTDTLPLSGNGKLMPTAALAVLEHSASWETLQAGTARLLQLVRPRELAD